MDKTPAKARVSVQRGSEQETPSTLRAIIKSNAIMALRLEALKFGAWWAR